MHKTFYEITNKSPESKSVDLLIYGAIPSWDEDTYKMKNSADKFVKDFKALENDYDRINIRINSPGGSLYHSFPIFNAIRNSKKDIHTYNDGLAASAGGLLLIAGKTVHSAKNGIIMIHNAGSYSFGNAEDMRQVAKQLDTYDGVITKLFAEKTGLSEDEVKEKYLNYKDHWMDADESNEAGFIDQVEDYESEDAPPSNIQNLAFGEVMNLYAKKDEPSPGFLNKVVKYVTSALAPAQDTPPPPAPAPEDTDTTNQTTNPMDFMNELEILNQETPSAEDLAKVKASIEAFTGANERFTSDEVTAKVDAAKTDLQNELNTVKNEKSSLETEITALKNTVEAYKATGVQIDNSRGDADDNLNDGPEDHFLTEADLEMKRLRAAAGITDPS